jgi:hypothetical protein
MSDVAKSSFRPARRAQVKAIVIGGALTAVMWFLAANSAGRGQIFEWILALMVTFSLGCLVFQLLDPRPLASFSQHEVRLNGRGRTTLGPSRTYHWREVSDLSAVRNQYPAALERRSGFTLLPSGAVRRGKRNSTDAFWVRTADGHRYKIWSGSGDPSLRDFRSAMQQARRAAGLGHP